ncbi:MAG: LacI family DNA-binding transcriptional regulator [Lachnospiraceae bacterium]
MLKMNDIADLAGVSIATVGRVIHNSGYVSQENRNKIERIISEKGYIPNRTAQELKGSKSKLIGHLTIFNSNMLYEEIAKSINIQARKLGYQIITIVVEREPEEAKRQIQELISRQVDGLIITSNPFIKKEHITLLEKAQIPFVFVEREFACNKYDFIQVDDLAGSTEAVNRIISYGHKEIGFIGLTPKHEVEHLRLEGYRQAISIAGIIPDDNRIYLANEYTVEEGKQAAKHIFRADPKVTAIFATSDILVCGVLQHCYEEQIRVPQELSIIGYDNTLSAFTAPGISSMKLPLEEIAVQAMDLLMTRTKDPEREPVRYTVRPIFIDRRSIAPR